MTRLGALAAALLIGCCGGGGPIDAAPPDAPSPPDAEEPADAGIDVILPECVIQGGHTGPPVVSGFTPDHVCRGAKVFVTGQELAGGCAMMNMRSMFIGFEEGDLITSFRIPSDMTPINDVFIVHNEDGTGMSPFVLFVQAGHIPVLTGIAPQQAMAGETFVVTGSNLLGASVELSNDTTTAAATVMESADDQLTVLVPAVPIGFYDVTVRVVDCGYAVSLNGIQVI